VKTADELLLEHLEEEMRAAPVAPPAPKPVIEEPDDEPALPRSRVCRSQ
jgi:hypothetical protein